MRFTQGEINTFKGIMNEFFYDWGMTGRNLPQIHKDNEGFWINKTALFKEDGEIYLCYKTDTFLVSPEAFSKFSTFYHSLYENDKAFERVLDFIEDAWFEANESEGGINQTSNGFFIGKLSILSSAGKCLVTTDKHSEEINKKTFEKVRMFLDLLN